jgi:DinB superfamily
MHRSALWILAVSLAAGLHAQSNPTITETKQMYESVKNNLIRAAEKMPEGDYSYKPTPEQQTFAQRIAHVANQVRTCSAISGQQKTVDTSKMEKAALVTALKGSFDACDAAWASMNDKTAAEMIAGRGGQRSKLGALIGNTNHDSEVYGYIAVYLRLKGIVPPSSERGRM